MDRRIVRNDARRQFKQTRRRERWNANSTPNQMRERVSDHLWEGDTRAVLMNALWCSCKCLESLSSISCVYTDLNFLFRLIWIHIDFCIHAVFVPSRSICFLVLTCTSSHIHPAHARLFSSLLLPVNRTYIPCFFFVAFRFPSPSAPLHPWLFVSYSLHSSYSQPHPLVKLGLSSVAPRRSSPCRRTHASFDDCMFHFQRVRLIRHNINPLPPRTFFSSFLPCHSRATVALFGPSACFTALPHSHPITHTSHSPGYVSPKRDRCYYSTLNGTRDEI